MYAYIYKTIRLNCSYFRIEIIQNTLEKIYHSRDIFLFQRKMFDFTWILYYLLKPPGKRGRY